MNKILLHLKSFLNKCIIALNEIKVKANKNLIFFCKELFSVIDKIKEYIIELKKIRESATIKENV